MRTVQVLKRNRLCRVYAVLAGDRLKFVSRDRSLAEAYYHGQEPGAALLLAVRVLLPSGEEALHESEK